MARFAAIGQFLRQRGGPWRRGDALVAALAILAVVLRWSDRARYALTWDAHMFMLALERYDVNALRPHAPGYPAYVALGHVANLFLADPNEAFIAVSILGTAAGAVLTYEIGRRLFGRGVAVAATAILLSAPLVHIHAMTTNSYAPELGLATLVALLALRCRADPRPRSVAVLAAAFAVAVGLRQSLAFFLTPLVAWAALRPPWTVGVQARRLLPAAGLGLAVGAAWFVPMAIASGGVATWRRANSLQSQVVFEHPVWTDGWSAVNLNVDRILLYLQWEWAIVVPLLALVLAAGALGWVWTHRRWPRPSEVGAGSRDAAAFLAVWGLPAALFYLTVYSGYGNGPSGYMLLLLPPFYLAAAWLAWAALRRIPWPQPAAVAGAVVALALASAGLVSHAHDAADVDYRVNDDWAASWSQLPASFPPANTTIVTAYNFAHVWLYYPDYHAYEYRPAGKAVGEVPDFLLVQHAYQHEATPDWYDEIADRRTPSPNPLPNGTEALVLFDFQLAGENGGDCHLKAGCVRDDCRTVDTACQPTYFTANLPNGWRVLYVKVTPDKLLLEDYFTMAGALPST